MKKLKLPKITFFTRKPKKLQATTVSRRAPSSESYYEEEPKTNLSSAFVVVLILHVVAVGGIYAFNSLRASRGGNDPHPNAASTAAAGSALAPKPKASTPAPDSSAPVSKTNVYHVQSGDNLTKIAAQFNVSVSDLEEANGIKNGAVLRDKQILTIPAARPAQKAVVPPVVQDSRKAAFLASKGEEGASGTATSNAAGRTYVVAKNDTPTSIAKKFGTNPVDLLKLNKIDDPKKMQIGQVLKVPAKKN